LKLPIKKEFFDQIKSGQKTYEIRDAHLTLICEETGESLRVDIIDAFVLNREDIHIFQIPVRSDLFEDDTQVIFSLGNVEEVLP